MGVFWVWLTSPLWITWYAVKGAIGALYGIWRWIARAKPQPLTTHGSASLAEIREFKKAGLTKPGSGFLLGKLTAGWWTFKKQVSVYSHHEASAIIYGPRGSGKSNLFKANLNALQYWTEKPDIIVVDPKGEFEETSREMLEEAGYQVRRMDLKNPDSSIRYDPLTAVSMLPHMFADDVRDIASLILPDDKEERFRHFTVLPRRLLVGSITYHMRCEPHRATLDHCLQAIVQPLDKLKEQTAKWARLANDPSIANAITVSKVVADREFSGFITTMTDKFEPFLHPNWRKIATPGIENYGTENWAVTERGWRFQDVYRDERPYALFIRPGLGGGEMTGANMRLIVGNAIAERRAMLDDLQWSGFKKKLLVFVDEAADLGNCEPLVKLQRNMRQAGVNLFMTFTSRADVFQNYPNAKTLMAGMAEVFPGGINDHETLVYASRMAGRKTVMGLSESESAHGTSKGKSEVGVPVIDEHTLYTMPNDRWFILNGKYAAVVEKPFGFNNGQMYF